MASLQLTIYSLKIENSFAFEGKTTIQELKYIIATKLNLPVQKFGSTIFLIYKGVILNLYSNEKLITIFQNNDTIFVINKEERVTSIDTIINERKNKTNNNFITIKDKNSNFKNIGQI